MTTLAFYRCLYWGGGTSELRSIGPTLVAVFAPEVSTNHLCMSTPLCSVSCAASGA